MAAVKAGIQAKGQRKLSTYSRAELTMMADALIAPWFIEQVRAKIAARTGHSPSICGQFCATGRGFSMTTAPALAPNAVLCDQCAELTQSTEFASI